MRIRETNEGSPESSFQQSKKSTVLEKLLKNLPMNRKKFQDAFEDFVNNSSRFGTRKSPKEHESLKQKKKSRQFMFRDRSIEFIAAPTQITETI